jgi:hypothetical protein
MPWSNAIFEEVLLHAHQLIQHRPRSFHPYAWLGVILTLRVKTLTTSTDPDAMLQSLQGAREATAECRRPNPLYAPCQVWQSRQLEALARLLLANNDNHDHAEQQQSQE